MAVRAARDLREAVERHTPRCQSRQTKKGAACEGERAGEAEEIAHSVATAYTRTIIPHRRELIEMQCMVQGIITSRRV